MTRLIKLMERTGALFLFVIATLITVSVTLRYIFNSPLPDSDAISRLLLSTVVFWGLAGACYHDEHIRVDLLWEKLPPTGKRIVSGFSMLFMLVCMLLLAWATFGRVQSQVNAGERTYDLGIPLWPFYALAWLGIAATLFALVARFRLEHGVDQE